MAMLKFDFGTLPVPRLAKGPPSVSEMGPLRVLDPDGFSVNATFTLPLLMEWLPLNVCFSNVVASPELPPPHAEIVIATNAAHSRASALRRTALRADTVANLPLWFAIWRRRLESDLVRAPRLAG